LLKNLGIFSKKMELLGDFIRVWVGNPVPGSKKYVLCTGMFLGGSIFFSFNIFEKAEVLYSILRLYLQ
jgi:hypothetical protein